MDKFWWNITQFRAPFLHIFTIGIKLLTLRNRVKNSKVRAGISAAARHPFAENRAGVLLAQAEVPQAMAEAFRKGNLEASSRNGAG